MSERRVSRLGNIELPPEDDRIRYVQEPILRMNGNTGAWSLHSPMGKVSIDTPFVEVVMISVRYVRSLYEEDYAEGGSNTPVCMSWGFNEAFGFGMKPRPGEDWRSMLKEHNCVECPTGAFRDDAKTGRAKRPICAPDLYALVMLKYDHKIKPVFMQMTGTRVKPVRTVWAKLERDEAKGGHPSFHFLVRLESLAQGSGQNTRYTVNPAEITALTPEQRKYMDGWVRDNFEREWVKSIDAWEKEAREIGGQGAPQTIADAHATPPEPKRAPPMQDPQWGQCPSSREAYAENEPQVRGNVGRPDVEMPSDDYDDIPF